MNSILYSMAFGLIVGALLGLAVGLSPPSALLSGAAGALVGGIILWFMGRLTRAPR